MPTKPVFIRQKVLEQILEITKKEGYVEDGKLKWHYVLNELLERAIALYKLGQLRLKPRKELFRIN